MPELPPDEANEVVVGDIFGRLNTTARAARMRAAFDEWRPDVVLRDPNEYSGALAAERTASRTPAWPISLVSTEEMGLAIAAPAIDAIRRAEGLAPDPAGELLPRLALADRLPARRSTRASSRTRTASAIRPGMEPASELPGLVAGPRGASRSST